MGIIFNYSKNDYEEPKNTKEEICNKKGPSFFLNKEFPNYKKIPLEEVLNNLLKSKYDLLENNQLTASLSKQFKLLYQQKSDINNNIKDFSFSQIEYDEDKNAKKDKIEINVTQNNNNINDLKMALLNNNNEDKNEINNNNDNNKKSIVKEIYKEQDKNIKKYKKNFYLSDYNIFSSAKNSEKIQNEENINNIINENEEENKNNLSDKKSNRSLYNKNIEVSPHKKIRKYTELESNIIQAASLLKDIRKEYRFKNKLGGGHFGTVRRGYRISEKNKKMKFFAIKSIPMKNLSCNINDFIKEVDIISTLDHPNIIKFYETFHDDYFFHIVMELCKGKDIIHQMGNYGIIEEKKVTYIIFKVLLAIAHCHNRGVTHRDLKPENILFDSMKKDAEIKILDFGLSRKYDKEQKMHSILGTPYYVAPEVLKGEYDEKCDIWSIGAMTYLMLCGEPPFNGNSNNEIFKKIVK